MNLNISSALGCVAGMALGTILFASTSTSANAETPRSVPTSLASLSHSVVSVPKRELDAALARVTFISGAQPPAYVEWADLPSYVYAEWNDWRVSNSAIAKLPSAVKTVHSPALPMALAGEKKAKVFDDVPAYTYLEWNGW
jgi:hypothetical protein